MNIIMLAVLSAFLLVVILLAIAGEENPAKPSKEWMLYLLFLALFSAAALLAQAIIIGA